MTKEFEKQTQYVSKKPDADGLRHYTDEENSIWRDLYSRQERDVLPGRACADYIKCLETLDLPHDRVPQLGEVNDKLKPATGWTVTGVPALISFEKFFKLLADRTFPAATFIRTREEFDYLREPDIFHEVLGHCPLLLNQNYADFMQAYGEIGLSVDPKDRAMLARLYWFTVEFGLIKESEGLRLYGAGIVSSVGESQYALSDKPEHRPIDLVDVFRRLYRIDMYQRVYYVIESFEQLYKLASDKQHIMDAIREARGKGPFVPTFPVEDLPEDDLRRKVAEERV